jgi:hypothetical protein
VIPIPGLDAVRCSWITVQGEGYVLYGFLLYTASDHFFPDYIDHEGLRDLDMWSGEDCAIFLVHSPSAEWIDYTKATNHTWWRVFAKEFDGSFRDGDYRDGPPFINEPNDYERLLTTPFLTIDGKHASLSDIANPKVNEFLHGREIANVLRWFDLRETQHPCMILFKDLYDESVWYVDLSDLVDIPPRDLRQSLKQWFAGPSFGHMLREASRA